MVSDQLPSEPIVVSPVSPARVTVTFVSRSIFADLPDTEISAPGSTSFPAEGEVMVIDGSFVTGVSDSSSVVKTNMNVASTSIPPVSPFNSPSVIV